MAGVSLGQTDRVSGSPPPQPASLFPGGAERAGPAPGVGKAQEVLTPLVPAWHQTPYFWTSTLWPAAELDYGERERGRPGSSRARPRGDAGEGGQRAPQQPLPVLPAIYLAKKNILQQGALGGHEKVGPTR